MPDSTDIPLMHIVGIDASRNRSGGAIAHLRGLFEAGNPAKYGIQRVHLWAHDRLLKEIDEQPWLTKHHVTQTRGHMFFQLWWQYAQLPKLARTLGVKVMFNTDAGSVCPFPASVTLSQDMLSFEPGEMQRYEIISKARLRLELLKFVQLRRLRASTLAIFLSKHAQKIISGCTQLPDSVVIPHGLDERFRAIAAHRKDWPNSEEPIRCLYISNVAPYKHQCHVVEAAAILRNNGYDVRLEFVGGGEGAAYARLTESIERFDPFRKFVSLVDFLPHEQIPKYLADSDLFIFASSCENLPITMLEAMASAIPICSSDRGPMPEVLGPDASYFDPEQPIAIAKAVESMIIDKNLRAQRVADSLRRSHHYTWQRCADETWKVLADVCWKHTK